MPGGITRTVDVATVPTWCIEWHMDTLRAAVVVLRVDEAGSFAGAARLLGVTPAAVARLVGRFEAAHGARLFRRSTRALSLTPDGERFPRRGPGPGPGARGGGQPVSAHQLGSRARCA